jgi:DNA-binding Lrp family transcriptional regulator
VSAPTVSRMLKSLEELGYIVRDRMDHDARMRRVYITRLGLEVVRAKIIALIDTNANERMALRGLDYYRKTARRKLERLRSFLSSMRKIYGDPAVFEHPWTTDDLLPPLIFTTMVDGALCYGAPFQA